ncbi:DUF3810 domain-containing protein [Echinicola salinicaeni]|uniref:DUF3810 domain-containing protein n=1 Tax=Echinicola salinicaeni TaxID=2762757 RepID=UPI001E5694AF|nr:DUF3810 domain-containing protein [Echinicola salinicaeni]
MDKITKGNWTWALLGLIALLIRYFFIQYPEGTEQIYSRGIFPVIRNLIDYSFGKFPVPSIYLFFTGLLVALYYFWKGWRHQKGWLNSLVFTGRNVLNFLGFLVFAFLLLWGFNYQRIPVFQQLSLEPMPLHKEELLSELKLTRDDLHAWRAQISMDTSALTETVAFGELEDVVRETIAEKIAMLGLEYSGNPRTRELYPGGFLRKLGILGIYFPFTGESYIDPTLHHLEKPFTLAHEMAHSCGVTDEGEANFFAWVVCTQSDIPLLNYSAQLRLISYQLKDLYRQDVEAYKSFVKTLEKGVRNDFADISENHKKIEPFSLEISRKSNDLYLKAQGVKAGVGSYAQLTMLAYAWRNKKEEGNTH